MPELPEDLRDSGPAYAPVGHVERVIYNPYKVAIVGFVPAHSGSGDTKLPFRIKGEIDAKAVRSRARTMRLNDRRWKTCRRPAQQPRHSIAFDRSKLYTGPAGSPFR